MYIPFKRDKNDKPPKHQTAPKIIFGVLWSFGALVAKNSKKFNSQKPAHPLPCLFLPYCSYSLHR